MIELFLRTISIMMELFLWTISIVGAWNAINMAARIYYKAQWTPYIWHVVTGIWAAWLLWAGK